jgi:hypothetical protein
MNQDQSDCRSESKESVKHPADPQPSEMPAEVWTIAVVCDHRVRSSRSESGMDRPAIRSGPWCGTECLSFPIVLLLHIKLDKASVLPMAQVILCKNFN